MPSLEPVVDLGDCCGVTQIRVHGVGGTSPESMLETGAVRRVAGDAIAGFYRAAETTPGRHVEAYSWGGLTSHSRVRALWILLLPFTFANLAGWTSPPRKGEPGGGRGPVHGFRLAAAKWAALALTLSIVLTLSLLAMDVLAYQCGAAAQCRSGLVVLAPLGWEELPGNPARRLAVGSLLVVLVLAALAALSFRTRERYEAVEPVSELTGNPKAAPDHGAGAPHLPGGLTHRGFWSGGPAHARLTNVHLAGGLATVATVLAFCALSLHENSSGWWSSAILTGAIALSGLAVLMGVVVLTWDRTPGTGECRQWPSRVSLVLAALGYALALAGAWLQSPPSVLMAGQTPGIVDAFNAAWVAVAVLVIPLGLCTIGGRRGTRRDADSIGWIPPFAAFGIGMIAAQTALLSLLIFVADWASGPAPLVHTSGQASVPLTDAPAGIVLPVMVSTANAYFVWGIIIVLVAAGLAFGANVFVAGRGRRLDEFLCAEGGSATDYDAELECDLHSRDQVGTPDVWKYSAALPLEAVPDGRTPDVTSWTRSRVRYEFLARASKYVSRMINVMVAAATVLVLFVWLKVWVQHSLPTAFWVGPAVAIALLIPPALLSFVLLSWRSLERRRVIGSVWDVATFWPRAFHPFAPPCYAERAVPELTRRIWWINDNGGEVVVVAHSQGSVVAAATALRHELEVDDKPRFSLVTYGSPLRKLYGHAFPAYWAPRTLRTVCDPETSLVDAGRWRNPYYLTDYIGGPVGIEQVDQRLPDPISSIYVYGQPEPPVLSHTGYMRDPRFWAIVDRMVEAAASGARRVRPGTDPQQAPAGSASA